MWRSFDEVDRMQKSCILFDLCGDVSKVNKSEFGNKLLSRSVAFHNSKRKEINSKFMDQIKKIKIISN